MLTTVQDLGRPGYGPMGISPSGAADAISLRLGNRLLGNPETHAALELTMLGGVFNFPDGATVAITGADFGASIGMNESVTLEPGATVRLGPARNGARAYLCVRGGIDTPPWLGSRSTHVLSGLGGHEGRALRKGDILPIGVEPVQAAGQRIDSGLLDKLAPRSTIRATATERHDPRLYEGAWRVDPQSNRMGIRLSGAALEGAAGAQMVTEGAPLGAVQLPPGGQPIILFVEQQTTGGYPKIANVIAADLASVGQLRPGATIRFELVDRAEALRLYREQEALLA